MDNVVRYAATQLYVIQSTFNVLTGTTASSMEEEVNGVNSLVRLHGVMRPSMPAQMEAAAGGGDSNISRQVTY